eukprot:2525398-Alexandrium_andersonii.AAC.1
MKRSATHIVNATRQPPKRQHAQPMMAMCTCCKVHAAATANAQRPAPATQQSSPQCSGAPDL